MVASIAGRNTKQRGRNLEPRIAKKGKELHDLLPSKHSLSKWPLSSNLDRSESSLPFLPWLQPCPKMRCELPDQTGNSPWPPPQTLCPSSESAHRRSLAGAQQCTTYRNLDPCTGGEIVSESQIFLFFFLHPSIKTPCAKGICSF